MIHQTALSITLQLLLLVGIANCTSLTLLGKHPNQENTMIIDNLFGKPFLSLSTTAMNLQDHQDLENLAEQVMDVMRHSGDSESLLKRLRSLELLSYSCFTMYPSAGAIFVNALFSGSKYKLVSDDGSICEKVDKIQFLRVWNSVHYFSPLNLYYEMMNTSKRLRNWCSFDASIGPGSITNGPFSKLSKDVLGSIFIHVLDGDISAMKILPLVCKAFHSVNILSVLMTRDDPERVAKYLLMTYGSPFEYQTTHYISQWMRKPCFFNGQSHEEVMTEWLAERDCGYQEIVENIIIHDNMNHFIPIMMKRPKRLLALLDCIRVVARENPNAPHLKDLLNTVFNEPILWAFMKDPKWMNGLSFASFAVLTSVAIKPLLRPNIREILCTKMVDANFDSHLPFFD